MFKDLVIANRSYRRFIEDHVISEEILSKLIELARLTPSAANFQPLKYYISNKAEINNRIFPYIAWARALKEWGGPKEGERPSAYVIICLDTAISKTSNCDHGIAAQTILLGAVEYGLGGCMIGSFNKPKVAEEFSLPEGIEPILIIALGKPAEKIVLEEVNEQNGSTEYYRDADDIHHVPKRKLKDILRWL